MPGGILQDALLPHDALGLERCDLLFRAAQAARAVDKPTMQTRRRRDAAVSISTCTVLKFIAATPAYLPITFAFISVVNTFISIMLPQKKLMIRPARR